MQEQPEFSAEEIMNDPELLEATRRAQSGQFQHTYFEISEDMLIKSMEATQGRVTIPVADQIMRAYPWLTYSDIGSYLTRRNELLAEALEVLQSCYPEGKDKEEFFSENEDDWNLHSEGYITLIVKWTALTNQWAKDWADKELTDPLKAVDHAVVTDITGLLAGPDGHISQMQHLANFEITDEQGRSITERVSELVTDE